MPATPVRGVALGVSVPGVRVSVPQSATEATAVPAQRAQGADKRVPVRRRPMPCPHCDAELTHELAASPSPSCPHCELALVPVEIAGFWRRVLGGAVDLAILGATAGPVAWGLHALVDPLPLAPGARGLDRLLTVFATDFASLLLRAGPLLVLVGLYFMFTVSFTGRTFGQRLLSMRVVDRHGRPPTVPVAGLRAAAQLAGLIPAALGPLWIAFDSERRAVHDLVAGTYVVRSA